MLKLRKVEKVIILTPGSLRATWISEYCNKCGLSERTIRKKYIFITYNYAVGKRLPSFDNCLVIIDEAHNLINGFRNKSLHPTLIYNHIHSAKRCRILALTGTPIINYLNEFGYMIDLLKPNSITGVDSKLSGENFAAMFTLKPDGTLEPKNKTSVKRIVEGIISYYPGSLADMPRLIEHEPFKMAMTKEQTIQYMEVSAQEEALTRPPSEYLKRVDPPKFALLQGLYVMALKNMLTRRVCNFYYPPKFFMSVEEMVKDDPENEESSEEKKKKSEGDKKNEAGEIIDEAQRLDNEVEKEVENKVKKADSDSDEKEEKKDEEAPKKVKAKMKDLLVKEGGWINKDLFKNKELYTLYSPKIAMLMYNIMYHMNDKHVLFTTFKVKGGVYLIRSLLKMCGIKSLIFSGDSSDAEKTDVLKRFNSKKNRNGVKYKILLITEAGAEGITVLEAQHMHILESNPRINKIIQAIGRTARLGSHKNLPIEDRTINVWKYWSVIRKSERRVIQVYNDDGVIVDREMLVSAATKTVDEILAEKGEFILKGINSFLKVLEEYSVLKE